MRVTTGIEDNAVMIETHALQFINQLALNIALKKREMNMREFLFQLCHVFFKRHIAVNIGFAPAKQVQVWSVDDSDFHTYIKGQK